MNILDVKIGTKLEIELLNSIGQKIGQTFVSQIIDIIDINRLVIAAPIHESRITYIPIGITIRAIFLHEKYGLLSFIGTVFKKDRTDIMVEFGITINTALEKIQRRDYFRLNCVLDAQYRINTDDTDQQTDQNPCRPYNKALTKNISGCGACVAVNEEIPKNTSLDLIIALDATTSVKAACKVIRSSLMQTNRGNRYEVGLYFTQISQKDQDAIIKHVFDKQKSLAKKMQDI